MGYPLRTGQAALWLACSLATPATFADIPDNLHEHPVWLTLGHYHQDTLGSGFTSQADHPAFFLSESGKTSPEAELQATLEAIRQPGGGDDHARCRFPARDAWLREQLDLPNTPVRSEEHTSELQSRPHLVCRLLLEKKKHK